MIFALLKDFADHALSRDFVELREERSSEAQPRCASVRPELEWMPSERELSLVFFVPGASASNTRVCWDAEVRTLSVWVRLVASGTHDFDWYAVLRLPPDIEGAKSRCTLKNGVLRVRAPREDTPGSTGLSLLAMFSDRALLSAACGA